MSGLKIILFLLGYVANTLAGTCDGRCGYGADFSYPCQCNWPCVTYENCCSDYIALCVEDSCVERCGHGSNSDYTCQCDTACTDYGDCCENYSAFCVNVSGTCVGRCGYGADFSYPCQCNSPCVTYHDCCLDYTAMCIEGGDGSSGGGATDPLSVVMDGIWDSDTNRFTSSELVINTTGSRLFTYVDECKFSLPTFSAFITVLDNYDPTISELEVLLGTSKDDIETFLDAVLATKAMNLAHAHLIHIGKVGSSQAAFRDTLKELWFSLYHRSSSQNYDDSSDFEYGMIGDLMRSTVSGFHSWIQFYREEKNGTLTYRFMEFEAEVRSCVI